MWQEQYRYEHKGTMRLLDDQLHNTLLFLKSNRSFKTQIAKMMLNREYPTRFKDPLTYTW